MFCNMKCATSKNYKRGLPKWMKSTPNQRQRNELGGEDRRGGEGRERCAHRARACRRSHRKARPARRPGQRASARMSWPAVNGAASAASRPASRPSCHLELQKCRSWHHHGKSSFRLNAISGLILDRHADRCAPGGSRARSPHHRQLQSPLRGPNRYRIGLRSRTRPRNEQEDPGIWHRTLLCMEWACKPTARPRAP